MRVVVVSSRFPWPPYTGDRLRATVWLDALGATHDVTLIAPHGAFPEEAPGRFVAARPNVSTFVRAASRVAFDGLPAHALIAATHDWRGALNAARGRGGEFDAAIVLLSRLVPWLGDAPLAPLEILDAIDSLAASTAQRSEAARGPSRLFWSAESRRIARLERRLGARFQRTVVVNESERSHFTGEVDVIANGVDIEPAASPPFSARRYDCGFWGRLAYFANERAVEVLVRLWQRVRELRPAATLLIAGADAPRWIAALDGRDGITVVSPMADRAATLRDVRVAFFPFAFGSGQSNKVLEAAEAGCAIVATPQALRGADPLLESSFVATDDEAMVRLVLDVLSGALPGERAGERGRELVIQHYSRNAIHAMMRAMIEGGRG